MIKIGDQVITKSYQTYNMVGKVTALYYENGTGDIVVDAKLAAATRIEVDWGTFGKSRVYLHDQNVSWFKHLDLN